MSIPWKAHGYQLDAVKFILGQGSAGLFADCGTGKTSISLAAFKVLRDKGLVQRALVIAPLRPALSTWGREASKWTEFESLRVEVLHGANKSVASLLASDISVINPEGLEWLFQELKAMKTWPFQMLIVDELSRFKHSNTRRFKLLKPYLGKFPRRVGLTGTPASRSLLDLFGQAYVLDQGAALGKWVTGYRQAYFYPSGFNGYDWKLQPGAEERIYTALRPLVLRLSAADLLDMPPLIDNIIEVELPPAARKAYAEMEVELLTVLGSSTVTAANAASAVSKCLQIAGGGVYFNDEQGVRHHKNLHTAKVDAVEDIVEERQGQPALVAYGFEHDLERLLERFPGTPHIGGGTTPKQQKEIEDAWGKGDLPVLFAQPQATAFGLNLQAKNAAIISHSLTWDLEIDHQFTCRVWRQGATDRVIRHRIVAKDTVDETVMRVLASKARTQSALLDALKEDLLK
jgi:SNF2 family DNA or RNA helicase